MKRLLLFIFIFLIGFSITQAKTEEFGTWIELTFTKKFLKDFEFSIIPELRLQDDFTIDEYIFEGKLGYEPFKFLGFAAAYRLNTNVKNNEDEISHSAVFDVTGKTDVKRFNASLRARFTNDSDGGDVPWESFYFRPRAKLSYNIKGKKVEPYISYEIFHSFREKEYYKARFDVGFSRKFNKKHEVGLYYRLNDYFSNRNSIHILGINYGFKF
jgi:hypothetical protein